MCGIIGVYGNNNAARVAAVGLFAEQHRGQESCGMAVGDGFLIRLHKKMGLVKEVFHNEQLSALPGNIAIGHVRYPTKGSATEFNTQPHLVETLSGPCYALASNGDIVNYAQVRKALEAEKVYFKSDNDGELLVKYIAYRLLHYQEEITDAIRHLMKDILGAYSSVLCTPTELYMFRDPYSIRPMTWGKTPEGTIIVASESCALDTLGVTDRQEVPPAGIIKVNEKGVQILENDPNLYRINKCEKHCIFEQIYFSRPDSFHFGENVYQVREKIGAALARQDEGLNPDLVVPVPDSSNFIGLGYANQSGIPLSLGLIRNHYIGRTFIKPEQTVRDESVRQKFNVLPNFFNGKRIVLIDDSIVRGTTIRKIVDLIKEAGAAEIHLRIGSPQIKHSCFYGIDTPTKHELVANRRTLDEIRDITGVDTLVHLSLRDLQSCVHCPEHYCYACFDGNYPIGVPDALNYT
ncbi:MAG TPA: amidophosphoribosyltransferase [Candidatus Cloacimonas sp.]|jgi:amidophosphoribosyltransferase|nr:amidophosphoribosyltransferase [Candidatus Cloacimonas sp.]MDD3733520.1 amidophosphoribosyltransferase [Candidatus Cloacimonadota bacterium]MCK9165015.1 amidophosphoribosyltransferase [Candidatus Cloacimonas sp.]HNV92886.1 amidophosphoribosyltransferase [Candidatus Cloacimonas sp.]HOG26773.1 amidophosphoribosyltransferase [Candidatus Cloacimonas sp.]